MGSPFHVGYVTLVGKPNVGKSTLMNRFLKQKLAIVTPKPQTTRHRILGIVHGENHQIILLDTPGIMHPKYLLQETMIKSAQSAIHDGDLILTLVDASNIDSDDERMLRQVQNEPVPKFLIFNKIDKINNDLLLPLIDEYSKTRLFQEIIPISALKNHNVDHLLELIIQTLPEGQPFFPKEMISSEPERFFVAELIREQLFILYVKEIPYSTTVHVENFKERPNRKDYIEAIITVERNSQKGIIIGKGGKALKKVGECARMEIEKFLGRPIFLKLEVRVREKWRRNPAYLRELGYL